MEDFLNVLRTFIVRFPSARILDLILCFGLENGFGSMHESSCRFVKGTEALELGTREAFGLGFAFIPGFIDSRLTTDPYNVIFSGH